MMSQREDYPIIQALINVDEHMNSRNRFEFNDQEIVGEREDGPVHIISRRYSFGVKLNIQSQNPEGELKGNEIQIFRSVGEDREDNNGSASDKGLGEEEEENGEREVSRGALH